MNEHSEQEAWSLVESDLSHWERMAEAEGNDPATEFIQLARTVLSNASDANT